MMIKTTILFCALAFLSLPAHAQTRMECLGYHVVEVPGEVEEATEPVVNKSPYLIGGGQFSETLRILEDGFDNGELTVEVSDPTTREQFDRFIPSQSSDFQFWIDPDSYTFSSFLLLWRAPRIFRISPKGKTDLKGQTLRETAAILSRFRTRALGEIPAEPGFCVPYGFIAGVSPLPYRSQTTLRMKDEPGLLYTVLFQSYERNDTQRVWFDPTKYRPGWEPFTAVKEKVSLLGVETNLEGWYSPTPYQETRQRNGRYHVVVVKKNGLAATVDRATSKGEVFVLTAELKGTENDLTKPTTHLQFNAFSFKMIDPEGLQAPAVKPFKKHLPGLKHFVGSLRLRPENEKAFREMKK